LFLPVVVAFWGEGGDVVAAKKLRVFDGGLAFGL